MQLAWELPEPWRQRAERVKLTRRNRDEKWREQVLVAVEPLVSPVASIRLGGFCPLKSTEPWLEQQSQLMSVWCVSGTVPTWLFTCFISFNTHKNPKRHVLAFPVYSHSHFIDEEAWDLEQITRLPRHRVANSESRPKPLLMADAAHLVDASEMILNSFVESHHQSPIWIFDNVHICSAHWTTNWHNSHSLISVHWKLLLNAI